MGHRGEVHVSSVFVHKSEEELSLRNLFDGRLPNCAFREPLPVSLLTSEGLASCHVPASETWWGSGYDFEDYYNGITIPDWICSWFGLPAVSETLLLDAFKKRGVRAPDLLVQAGHCQAVLRVLPQGWSWSVCQPSSATTSYRGRLPRHQ